MMMTYSSYPTADGRQNLDRRSIAETIATTLLSTGTPCRNQKSRRAHLHLHHCKQLLGSNISMSENNCSSNFVLVCTQDPERRTACHSKDTVRKSFSCAHINVNGLSEFVQDESSLADLVHSIANIDGVAIVDRHA